MELKAIKIIQKPEYETVSERKNKLFKFIIENKKISIPTMIMLLIYNKSFAMVDLENIQPTMGILPYYEPTLFEKYIDISENFVPIITITILIIFNIITIRKYKKNSVDEVEKKYKKKLLKNNLIILAGIFILWVILAFILYHFSDIV